MNGEKLSFFEKFFYYRNENGTPLFYHDGLGGGIANDFRYWFWIGITFALGFFCYNFFKNRQKQCKKFTIILAWSLLIPRTIRQFIDAVSGLEVPAWRALPFELCTILSFAVPLSIIFNWDKIKHGLYTLAFLGSVVTMIGNDYFDNLFVPCGNLESIWAHTLLFILPILENINGNYKIEWKSAWKTVVTQLVLALWALTANLILLFGYGIESDYMFLMKDNIGFGLSGHWYLLAYAVIFAIYILILYGGADIYRKIRDRKKQTATQETEVQN